MESFIKNVSKIEKQLLSKEEAQKIVDEIWNCNEPSLLIYAAKAIGVCNDAISMARIRVVENHFCGLSYKFRNLYHLFIKASNLVRGCSIEGRVSDVIEEMKQRLDAYEDLKEGEYEKTMDMILALEDASVGYVTEPIDRKRCSTYAVKEAINSEIAHKIFDCVKQDAFAP